MQDNAAVVQQVIGLAVELDTAEVDVFAKETELDQLVDRLYGLSEADIRIVTDAEGKKEQSGTANRMGKVLTVTSGTKVARESA